MSLVLASRVQASSSAMTTSLLITELQVVDKSSSRKPRKVNMFKSRHFSERKSTCISFKVIVESLYFIKFTSMHNLKRYVIFVIKVKAEFHHHENLFKLTVAEELRVGAISTISNCCFF